MINSCYIYKNISKIRYTNSRFISSFREKIEKNEYIRNKDNIPNKPLNYEEVSELCKLLIEPDKNEYKFLYQQISRRIVPGVDDTSKLKANFLYDIATKKINTPIISDKKAIHLLGTMQGGYSVEALIKLLSVPIVDKYAYYQLKKCILIFDYYNDIEKLYKNNNQYAEKLIKSWSEAEWFTSKKKVPEKITMCVFKVNGEINTDDLSPAQDAWSRPDIPLHSLSMLKNPREGVNPDNPYEKGPMIQINDLKSKNIPIVLVSDVLGTGSSRKSATNSILWHFGEDIPYVPNKKTGGICIANKIAPIFFNTMEDSGSLPIEMDVQKLKTGDIIDIYPYEGKTKYHDTGELVSEWKLKNTVLLDSIRAGGRINLIIGKNLTKKSCKTLNKDLDKNIFTENKVISTQNKGFTLAQKMVGKACGLEGVRPNNYYEPTITSVGSQDTTGPMTRDELKDLACLGFSADLVMQSFCHTAAYPKPVDLITHNTLPDFMNNRGGISLKPGDGIIHSWLNRMLLPDTVGTGGDSHTRFPIGISFPAGSGLVAFAGATGTMPLDMPESVLVRFSGEINPGITIRDIVHSIPYYAKKFGHLTLDKKNKKNVFNGRIIEIEGLPNLTCEQAFELSDASAERSAAGCTIKLNKEPIIEYLESNITLLNWMIKEGYQDKNTLERRINKMKNWLSNPILLEADQDCEYHQILDINLSDIKEPILCAPNDPDKTVLLSEVCDEKIDEVFIGSCMTNIGHFRAAGKLLNNTDKLKSKLWIAPPTKMDELKLKEEGFYDIFNNAGVTLEMPGCSLCMGNQARVEENSNVVSTSTRNFPNRLGQGAKVYLASAELSAITSIEGKIPDMSTYMSYFSKIEDEKEKIFQYLNFNKLDNYTK